MRTTEIIAAGGDIGGAMALLPVLRELDRRKIGFSLVDHGIISGKSGSGWETITEEESFSCFESGKAGVLIFTTSVKDDFPLKLARFARGHGSKVFSLLDNWMNYRYRMEIDAGGFFQPDMFFVMDEYARQESIKDGFDEKTVVVTGQPAIAGLKDEYAAWLSKGEVIFRDSSKINMVFISEPVEQDNGKSAADNPNFRGYTEKTALKALFESLEGLAGKYSLSIIPHPREDKLQLESFINEFSGGSDIRMGSGISGRNAVFSADIVIGMASILLYEAWLIGKPVASLQPCLRRPHLRFLNQEGILFLDVELPKINNILKKWLQNFKKTGFPSEIRGEAELHSHSADYIADILSNHLNRRIT
ncbi:MAG TPA: hypothetical protein DCZ94_09425 [Lentisphaeria bacterium]|nr:MAG: hypothetical protein A2X48_18220 [Lentisphaerae bacterium GWF2_49_21]HBC87161.1 hypothetical protein [Lentisphaeria bacterium]